MTTEVKLFDVSNRDKAGNGQYLEIDLSGIQFMPRIGENVFFENNHYSVKEIQHLFRKESECEIGHEINIHLTTK